MFYSTKKVSDAKLDWVNHFYIIKLIVINEQIILWLRDARKFRNEYFNNERK